MFFSFYYIKDNYMYTYRNCCSLFISSGVIVKKLGGNSFFMRAWLGINTCRFLSNSRGIGSADFNASSKIIRFSILQLIGLHTKKSSSFSLCNNFFCSKPAAFKKSSAPSIGKTFSCKNMHLCIYIHRYTFCVCVCM